MENDLISIKTKLILANREYRSGTPIISDQEFDDLLDYYKTLVSSEEYEILRNSLHEPDGKIVHKYVMGSLDKIKYDDPNSIITYLKRYIKHGLNVSAKVDGISCELVYKNGILVEASTRGDGYKGQFLTDKIIYVNNIPNKIDLADEIHIRGELIITQDNFFDISDQYANPRNATAGFMNRKDWNSSDISKISFISYSILGSQFNKDYQFKLLNKLGFITAWNTTLVDIDYSSIADILFKYATQNFEYETDGLVLSDSDYYNEDKYRPDAQVAFKINQQTATTKLINVEWGIDQKPSKDGFFIPVGIIAPVELGGVFVSRVTLHNLDFSSKFNLKYGSSLTILRSGDVIPKIISATNDNSELCEDIDFPSECPCCGTPLIIDGVNLRCPNKDCRDQRIYQVEHFIKKLEIKSASFKTLENFNIYTFDDLLKFKANSKYKSQSKFESELYDKVFSRDKRDIFCALNFRGLSEILLSKIVDWYGWDIIENDLSSILSKPLPAGIGDITIKKFIDGAPENLDITRKILDDPRYHYVEDINNNSSTKAGHSYIGSVCFTGKLNTMSRSEASRKAEAAGYEVKPGVSKGLTYLVTNDSQSGSSKNKKAKELGVKVIDESEFLKLVTVEKISTDIFDL